MRTLRLGLAGVVTLTLLGGSGSVTAAQDEVPDAMAPAWVTGTVAVMSGPSGAVETSEGGVTRRDGMQAVLAWVASDARLSGTSNYTGNWASYAVTGTSFPVLFEVQAGTQVLVNDEGRWTGTVTALVSDSAGIDQDTVILHGEGAYEGLTAYLLMDWSSLPADLVGAIFPGEMPSPLEPEATAE